MYVTAAKSPLCSSPTCTWPLGAAVWSAEMSGCFSEVEICVNVARVLLRRLPLFEPRPPQEQHFTTRAQHLEDVQNMSGSAHTRSHSTDVGKHRPPFNTYGHLSEEGVYLRGFNLQRMLMQHMNP